MSNIEMGVAHSQTVQQIAKDAFGSTVLLIMEDANGQPLSLGSGFVVREGEIVTNLHVVAGATAGYAKLVGKETTYEIEGITAIDANLDLVLLKTTAFSSPTLTLGDSDAVQIGDSIYAVGNPQGLEGTFSQGIVSGIREFEADRILQITAPISPGSSGGPVLDSKGDVIGVSVATFVSGQNLNFAIPSNYLKLLIGKAGPVMPLAEVQLDQSQGTVLADLGGRSSESVVGGQIAWNDSSTGAYTFSLRNNLQVPVMNVRCLVIFRDDQGSPIDVDIILAVKNELGNTKKVSVGDKELFFEESISQSDIEDFIKKNYPGAQAKIVKGTGMTIPPGLARRVKSRIDSSVADYTKRDVSKIEIRILDFEIVK
jgi:hypothetical protein